MSERVLVPALLLALTLASVHVYSAWKRAQRERMLDEFARRWSDPKPRVTCQLLVPARRLLTKEAFLSEKAKPRPRRTFVPDPLFRVSVGLGARRAKAKARTGGPPTHEATL